MDSVHHRNWDTHVDWMGHLDGLPVTLNVPWITPEEREKPLETSTREMQLPKTLLEKLQHVVERQHTTLQTVLLAALQTVLYHYTHDEVFVVANMCKNNETDLPAVHTLVPMKADLAGNPDCQELLTRVQRTLNEIQAVLSVHSNSATELDIASHPYVVSWLAICHNKDELDMASIQGCADIGLICLPEQKPAHCLIIYTPSLLPNWFIEQWFRHFLVVLDTFCRDMEQKVDTLTLLTVREQGLLREKWKGEHAPYPLSNKLHVLFEEQVARTPNSVALLLPHAHEETLRLSYQQLNRYANEVARELIEHGVKRDTVVGVYLARSSHAVVALLAILKAGGVYLPLDTIYPDEHLRMMLAETEAPILLTTRDMQEKVHHLDAQIMYIEELEYRAITANLENPQNMTTTDDLAIIMYTSGTTGKPKGVKHRQRQVVNRLYWMWELHPFRPGDIACQRSPLGVMPSMWELLGGLLKGIPTLVVPDAQVKDIPLFVRTLAMHRVSYVTLVPSQLRQMLHCQKDISSLKESMRLITIGGEVLSPELYQRIREAFPTTFLLNDYGCTEANTILHQTFTPTDKDLRELSGSRSVANLEVYILDEKLQLVPAGVQGEICVGGVGVSMGYLNRPELTSEKFVVHPFHPGSDKRLYRTGDQAYFLPDGTIKLLGRMDHQVKINGMRIELEGVEAVFCQHAAIREVAVVATTLKNGARQLHAYLVTYEGVILPEDELRDFLAAHLPRFMVPAHYHFVASLPRTPGGKLDRRALAALQVQPHTHALPLPNSDVLIMELRQLLARDVLETTLEVIDAEKDFYALGVDSVLMIEFARKLGERFGFDCSVAILYDYGTLKKLSVYILETLSKQQQPEDNVLSLYQETPPILSALSTRQQIVSSTESLVLPSDDIAIIGVSGRFPQANNLTQFWHNLAHGMDAVTEVPIERWKAEDYYASDTHQNAKSVSRWGAFLDDIDKFEPLFFSIAPAEAKWMDPQQRLCLEESWKAVEDAGYTPERLSGDTVGVFVGAKKGDYAESARQKEETPHGYALLGNDPAMIAARVAYHFDFHGPCLTIDTACSSSLVAVHLACQSIKNNECSVALAGGVCVVTEPHFYVATSKLGILSPTGKCRAFDTNADGFVQGEGVAFIVLKTLKKARQDGDTIYGVIKASAINHDGKTNGIGAPGGLAQTSLQSTLYQKSGIDPASISYVEAHGTGTKIGDPIEVQALTRSFQLFTHAKQFCALGSLKSNIGHLTAASGIAGLIKILLCFNYKQLPPSIHFTIPNEHIDFANSPFYVNDRLQAWNVAPGMTRMAALNSFGLGGTNAHCVLEEPLEQHAPPSRGTQPGYLIVISARTVSSLRQKISDLRSWLIAERAGHSLLDISYTLLTGRKFFPLCCIYYATDLQDLAEQLTQSLKGAEMNAPFCQLQAQQPSLDPLLGELGKYLVLALGMLEMNQEEYEQKVCALADLMARGFRFDGALLFKKETGHRIPLPTYPFLRERHWFREMPPPSGQTSAITHITKQAMKTNGASQVGIESATENMKLDSMLRTILAHLLEIDEGLFSPEVPLDEYGFDSIRAVTLKYEMEKRLVCEVPIEIIGQCKTMHELSEHLATLQLEQRDHTTQPDREEHLKQQFLRGEVSLSELSSDELDILFGVFAKDTERTPNEA